MIAAKAGALAFDHGVERCHLDGIAGALDARAHLRNGAGHGPELIEDDGISIWRNVQKSIGTFQAASRW